MTKDNHLLGKINLESIECSPDGIHEIEIIFDLDANGILNVSATDLQTENTSKIFITND